MFVYLRTTEAKPRFTMMVTPGLISSDFVDESGKPKTVTVVFENGRAEVPGNLGNWMCDTQRASRVPYSIIMPDQTGIILPRRIA